MSGTHLDLGASESLLGPFRGATDLGVKNLTKPMAAPFSLRLTQNERALIEAQAGGKPLGAYIRSQLLDGKQEQRRSARRPSVDEAAVARALAELGSSRLASNMNQIAKAANIGVLDVNDRMIDDLRLACCDIRQMRNALIQALGLKVEGRD